MLYLCEKPKQAKDIATVIGGDRAKQMNGFIQAGNSIVTWVFGHVMELAEPEAYGEQYKKWSLDSLPIIPSEWKLTVKHGAGKQFKIVTSLLKSNDQLIIATDPDREGEVIAREILESCNYQGTVKRLWLSGLDVKSVRKCINNLLDDESTKPLYYAGLGRSRSDWLVGMNMTRAYTCIGRERGYDGVLSVGRVQTPALALVVERNRLIDEFIPQLFYTIEAELVSDATEFTAKWLPDRDDASLECDAQGRCTKEQSALHLAQTLTGSIATVTDFEIKKKSLAAPAPPTLLALQKLAAKKWSYTVKETLDIMQSLYENHKATSYPRTACAYLPTEQFDEADEVFQSLKSILDSDENWQSLLSDADTSIKCKYWNTDKVEAHHAIIPTLNSNVNLEAMNEKERNLYDLVVRHYVAQFYPPYKSDQTVINLTASNVSLKAIGSVPTSMGWKAVISSTDNKSESESLLPKLISGNQVPIEFAKVVDKKTKPPTHYVEASLADAMENIASTVSDPEAKKILKDNEGIGTAATHPGIIETLKKRNFIVASGKKKHLLATDIGKELIQILPDELSDPVMTALMERLLNKVSSGEMTLDSYLAKQATYVTKLLEIAISQKDSIAITPSKTKKPKAELTDKDCPKCSKKLVKRKGKKGYFLGCSGYPDCTHIEFLN